ncbi:hypothetical protein GV819_04615 [Pseudomonas sp. Fl5BN2]|uniref:hypothetical protein n=1 Tax=unclassified Pseudomonas TaxID=196821 RepID=UPI001377D916|nr:MULTISPECIES: hypothetical protein [unclassified Pseudomonas]NBF01568.1 hypothetical protein [Pseudomonas sp. Fl5BN2]NBF07080.1 hypothetical protein [Pseudomonas sp. Fl4BN1]
MDWKSLLNTAIDKGKEAVKTTVTKENIIKATKYVAQEGMRALKEQSEKLQDAKEQFSTCNDEELVKISRTDASTHNRTAANRLLHDRHAYLDEQSREQLMAIAKGETGASIGERYAAANAIKMGKTD